VHVHISTIANFVCKVYICVCTCACYYSDDFMCLSYICTVCDAVHAWGVVLCFFMHDDCSITLICLQVCNVRTECGLCMFENQGN
jgi:hypothetical protein